MAGRPISAAEAEALLAPLQRFPRIAVAVSGGPDSLALLYLIAGWVKGRNPEPEITALTVDHRLRPSSREEAEAVAKQAARLGVPHATLTWSHGDLDGRNVQERARQARYSLMAGYCHAHGIPALLTAHQLDDQAETMLMRLKRGSGLDGLAAIPGESAFAGLALLRPLLDVRKERLVATLASAGIGYASDPSNADPRFERTTIRRDMAALGALGFSPEAFARSAARLRRARAALDETAARFLASEARFDEAGFALIARDALLSASEEIALRALSRVLAAIGGRPEPIRLSKLEALLSNLGEAPQRTHTLGGCRIEAAAEDFAVYREMRAEGLPEFSLRPGEKALWDNRFSVQLGGDAASPVMVRALGQAETFDPASLSPELAALPRRARLALPAAFSGGTILLPELGAVHGTRCGSAPLPGHGFNVRFVSRG